MRTIWMGISPGAGQVRVLAMDGPGRTLLKARLPPPGHPRALATLCEAVALWCGRRVRAALAADAPETLCESGPWPAALSVTDSPPFEIAVVVAARPPRERDCLDGMGDLRDVRQLVLFETAR